MFGKYCLSAIVLTNLVFDKYEEKISINALKSKYDVLIWECTNKTLSLLSFETKKSFSKASFISIFKIKTNLCIVSV